MRRMLQSDRRITSLRKMAWACAALVLAITTLSAYIRLSAAGLGCQPWPQCYGDAWRMAAEGVPLALQDGVAAARVAHRILAVSALLLIIAMLMSAYAKSPALPRHGRMALGLLGLALFLAILGRVTAGSRVPAVTLGNLGAGFAMLALSWRLAALPVPPGSAAASPRWLTGWAWVAGVLLVTQILLGGLVSAGHAGLSCPQLPGCDTSAGSWELLNPWHVSPGDPSDRGVPSGSLVHALHRAGAWVLMAVLVPLGIAAWRNGRRAAGGWLLALLAVQTFLGAVLVAAGLPLPVALAHNAVAALLLAAVAVLAGPALPRSASSPGSASQEK